jgi:phenylalanyl-tRNA synthetase beta chain
VTLNKKIHSVEVFDVYQGENIPSGKKSMAISITFLDEEKTLTDGEVATLMKNIQDTLSTKFLAEVRAA